MEELKCKECGAVLAQEAKECPVCGCPVEEAVNAEPTAPKPTAPQKEKRESKINITAIISLLLGIAIIIMGGTVINKEISIDTYRAEHYNAEYAEFGGDFYTYIYGASDTMVDELNAINSGVELISESMSTIANIIYYPAGMIIIAIGLGVVAMSVNHIKKENI